MKTLLIMAGGTGGHIYPALAIAKVLNNKGVKIVWLGTRSGLESRIVPEAGFDVQWMNITGFRRTGIKHWLKLPMQLSLAIFQAYKIISQYKPDAILSMGGFVAGPGGIAGVLKRIPLIIHEANAHAGMTNKYLSKVANKVMCAFSNTQGLPEKAITVGNPVAEDIVSLGSNKKAIAMTKQQFNLLIIGGSLGAQSFNQTLPEAISILDKSLLPKIMHQTGKGKLDPVISAYQLLNIEADVREFISDMGQSYAWADLVVCRAGAMTLAEITMVGLPAIIVPYPYSAGDHQVFNARYLESHGAGVVLLHEELSAQSLARHLSGLLAKPQTLQQMHINSQKLARPNATLEAVKICEEVLYA